MVPQGASERAYLPYSGSLLVPELSVDNAGLSKAGEAEMTWPLRRKGDN